MKKKILTICLLLSVFTVAVYAETEQNEINQVLSLFKSYEVHNGGRPYESEIKGVKQKFIEYAVHDYNGKSWGLRLYIQYFKFNSFQYSLSLYEQLSFGDNFNQNPIEITVYSPKNTPFYPIQDFKNTIIGDSRIAVNTTKSSPQIAQTPKQNQPQKSFTSTQTSRTSSQTTSLRANPSSDFLYEFRDNNTNALRIIKYVGTSSTIVIPESIEGIPVTAITKLDLNKQVRYNIYVPRSVNFIGGWVFNGIKGNISIDIENTTFFEACFSDSDLLSGTLTVSKITLRDPYHQYWVFDNTKISKLIVKEGVTEIPNGCFKDCKNLTSISLPNTIQEIDSYAFMGCTALTEVNIPVGKKIYIGPGCFEGCTSLSMATRKKLIECGYEGTFN